VAKAISNKNVTDAKFKFADFEGSWLASFGKPELSGVWIIYGGSGSGKTHFALGLIKYLSGFVGKVAYNTLEQGTGTKVRGSFQDAWKECSMDEIGSKIVVLPREPIEEMRERLRKRKSPDIVVIDSITALIGFTRAVFAELVEEFPNKLFIFLAHEENRRPYPTIAAHIRKWSEIKIRVEGYKAFVTTRFRGGTGSDFVIWDKGAQEYWAENL
jgi:hypothetical protein